MSPPSSNDPRSPNGPPDAPRRGRTAMELDVVGPHDPRARPETSARPRAEAHNTTFGLAPMVTQPFAAFTDPRVQVPQSERATQPIPQARSQPGAHAEDPRTASDSRPAAPPQAVVHVSVGRMQEIGHQGQPTPAPASAPSARLPFAGTMIAAGHRVAPSAPEARAPVPAYPSQPYEDVRSAVRTPVAPERAPAYSSPPYEDVRSAVRAPVAREPEPARELPVHPGPGAQREPTRAHNQFAQTTCSDLSELIKYPVPLPEFGGSTDGAPVAWSQPVAESGRPTPAGLPARRVERAVPEPRGERAVPEPRRELRERRPVDDDEIDLDRTLGRSKSKWIVLSAAVVVAFGLLGLSSYVKRSRSADAEVAIAAAPEAAPLPAREPEPPAPPEEEPQPVRREHDQAVDSERVGAPAEEAEDEEQPVLRKHAKPTEPAEEPDATEESAPAPHTTPGGVTASSAAALYINGQYKEALAEYQLLARAYPKQHVYVELARILRRKLIETCMRTQPHRREQCKTL